MAPTYGKAGIPRRSGHPPPGHDFFHLGQRRAHSHRAVDQQPGGCTLPGPTTVTVVCQNTAGVTADGYTTDAWSRLSDESWLTNIYRQGGVSFDGVPTC
jgi:hypothetical protein